MKGRYLAGTRDSYLGNAAATWPDVTSCSRPMYEPAEVYQKVLGWVLDPKWLKGRTVIQAIVEGSPKVEIIRYARKHEIDPIVLCQMGSWLIVVVAALVGWRRLANRHLPLKFSFLVS